MKSKIALLLPAICLMLSSCFSNNISANAYTAPDYSDHTYPNEERYVTMLGDLSNLKKGEKVIVTQEPVYDWSSVKLGGLAKKQETCGYDVRHADLSKEDLSGFDDVNGLSFNTRTIWPDKLPEGFDPDEALELNKNPGLGIRSLHDEGITGAGVGIGMIDQGLFVEHEQYVDRLMVYEKIHGEVGASMHGASMASIAVGKDTGVAPGSKLYFIGMKDGHSSGNSFVLDGKIIADGIYRILEMNRYLPKSEKIRVISISQGYGGHSLGWQELHNAIKRADEENILVVTASTGAYYDFSLEGMDRDVLSDPDSFVSYYPIEQVSKEFFKNSERFLKKIWIPAGHRIYAACFDASGYEMMSYAGTSAAVAWLSGFYALCCQVKPEITPKEFVEIIKSTGVTTEISYNGKDYPFSKIINPQAIISELKK